MRISPGCGAPRSSASAPCWSDSSRFENPPRPRSNTPCTRQSVPMLPGLLTQVPSARRNVRPGQRSSGPGSFAASSRSTKAARNSVAWSSRYLTPGLLSSAIPCIDAQAAVWRNERPPGPRASAIRNRAAPSTTSRRRWMALLSIARSSRSRSAGSRAKTSANRSRRTDPASCICSQNQAAPSRVKNYFSAYAALPPTPSGSGDADVLRASQLQHAVQDVDRHVHLRRPTLIRMRVQPVANHLLPSADGSLGPGAVCVPRRCLPGRAPVLGDELEVAVALRRRALSRLAWHGRRARRYDDGRLGVALPDAGVNTILVVRTIAREGGHRSVHLNEEGTGLGAVIHVVGGQRGGDDLAGVSVHAEMQMLWGRRRGDGTIVAGSVMELPMPKPADLNRCLAALDQEHTIIAVIEM